MPKSSVLKLRALYFALGVTLWIGAGPACGEEPPELPPAPKLKAKTLPAKPITLEMGASKAAWELLIANKVDEAEKAFREVLNAAPKDLNALEGLRACCMFDGRYREAQELNLRMLKAAADSELCLCFAYRATDLSNHVESRAELLAAIEEVNHTAPASVKLALQDLSSYFLASLERVEEARAALRGSGYITQWQFVAGPFGGTDALLNLERRFAPERPLKDLNFPGTPGVKVLRDVGSALHGLNLSDLFSVEPGVYYAFANLESAKEQEVVIMLSAPRGTQVFLRGVPVFRNTGDQAYPSERPRFRTRLAAGSNPVLVKLAGVGELSLQVTSTDLGPADCTCKALPAEALAAHEVVPVRGFLFSDEACGPLAHYMLDHHGRRNLPPARALREIARKADLTLAEATWLDWAARTEGALEAREQVALRLQESFPNAVSPLDLTATILSAVGETGGHTEARHLEDARALREHALELVPTSHQHLLALSIYYGTHDLKEKSFELIKACATAHPESALVQERLGEAYVQKELFPLAEKQFERAAALEPRMLSNYADFLEEHGSRPKARELRAKLHQLKLITRMAGIAGVVQAGHFDEAHAILAAERRDYPESAYFLDNEEAKLLEHENRPEDALKLRRALCAAFPKNRDYLMDAVDLALRLGQDTEARTLLETALKAQPGNFSIQQRLELLAGKSGEPWWAPYDVKVEQVDTSHLTQERYPRSNHAWAVDFMVTKVGPELGQDSYVHIAQKVLNAKGIDELSEILVEAQRQSLLFIRNRTPDGQVFEPRNAHDFVLAQTASAYRVSPGSILEHAYTQHVDPDGEKPRLYMAFNFMALDAPRAISRWIVLLPKNHKLRIRKIRPELIDEQQLPAPDGYIAYQWTNKEKEGVHQEPNMPEENDEEVIPLVIIESEERALKLPQLLAPPTPLFLPEEAASQARVLTRRLTSPEAKFHAIVEWVRQEISEAREPLTLEDVWNLRSGDPNQMTSLALAMCQSVGLPVHAALINSAYVPGAVWKTKNARRDWEPNQLAAFSPTGRMLVLESPNAGDNWMQFRQNARWNPPGELRQYQAGALALVQSEEGARLVRVHGEELDVVGRTDSATVTLDEEGGATVSGVMKFSGSLAARARIALNDPRRSEAVRQDLVRALWPRLDLAGADAKGEAEPEVPLRLEYRGTLQNLATAANGHWVLNPYIDPPQSLLDLAGPPERIHDLVLKSELSDTPMRVAYEAPPGCAWTEVPEDLALVSEFGLYLVDFNVRGRTLYVTRSWMLPMQRVTPAQYPKLMEFIKKVSASETRRVAYSRANFVGFQGLARPVFSAGATSNGEEDAPAPVKP